MEMEKDRDRHEFGLQFQIESESTLQNKTFKIKIQKVGQEHCQPRKKHEVRRRSYYSLHFIIYGCGELLVNGEAVSLKKGKMFLLYKEERYEYYPSVTDPWSYIWIDFYGEGVEELFAACGFTKEKPYIDAWDFHATEDFLKQLVQTYGGSELSLLSCSGYFTVLLSQLIAAHKKRVGNLDEEKLLWNKRLREVLMYINNNYRMDDLTPERIARDNYISVSRLMSLFSSTIKMSPCNYINRFRISNACVLLKETSYSVKEISSMVGFVDEKYFTRVFSKWKGTCPRDYRNESAEDPFLWLKEKGIDLR